MKRMRTALATLVGLALVMSAVPTAAMAATDRERVDPQIVELLAEVPGGVVIDANHAVWPELDMEYSAVTATDRSARAVGSCATGRICAYSDYNRAGGVLSWGSCGNIPIPASFTTRSAANARTSGLMRVRSGTTVLVNISANSWANVYGSANNILCLL